MFLSLEEDRPGLRGNFLISGLEEARERGYGDWFENIRYDGIIFQSKRTRDSSAIGRKKPLRKDELDEFQLIPLGRLTRMIKIP
ncbi:hypothetical protein TNCV_5089421 [Trichonephila clavipes]|nr:hypothetical protein TNCV_5089421 [Trichonephila clavipes]